MLSVIQAYVNVTRDMEILRIRQENLSVLQRQLEETSARFEVGEITRTDVAQAEASQAQSEADLANAQAQLATSRAAYAAVVGQSPTDLEAAPTLPAVPTDFDVAMETALQRNPGVLAATYQLQGAEAAVAAARSEYMPSLRATASYGGSSNDLGDLGQLADRRSFTAGATLSVPLFTGGLNQSRVAQALERANAAQMAIEGERRTVLQNVSSAYAQVLSTRANVTAGTEAVRAASVAAEGVRQEAQVGLRTTLDVLNQEVTLRASQTAVANARAARICGPRLAAGRHGPAGGTGAEPHRRDLRSQDQLRSGQGSRRPAVGWRDRDAGPCGLAAYRRGRGRPRRAHRHPAEGRDRTHRAPELIASGPRSGRCERAR